LFGSAQTAQWIAESRKIGSERQRVVVAGMGYIGLPTAALVASAGFAVTGVDVRPDIVATVNAGVPHIEETDLDALVQSAVAAGWLQAALQVPPAEVFLIAVPTPLGADNAPDVEAVMAVARAIAPVLKRGDLVILESTSPTGTTERICALMAELRPDLSFPMPGDGVPDVHVAYCPERVLPGRTLVELVANDRCIGGMTPACAAAAKAFYSRFVGGECFVTTARTAEMVKLVENSFRDVNIAFANELSMICDHLGIDVWEVIRLANRHPRVTILEPGPGVGGHCIAVDPWFVVHSAPAQSPLIRTARQVNDGKALYVIDRAVALAEALPGAEIACLGLAFKADIGDLRESPALKVAATLARRYGARIKLVEPHVADLPAVLAGSGAELVDLDTALARCEVLLLLVDHAPFRAIAPERRAGKMVYDTRGVWA
jgi:UDP-N-acetyl-D-mannosaminuronic acid dehydrogenase